jgi:hypothetical protein
MLAEYGWPEVTASKARGYGRETVTPITFAQRARSQAAPM